MYSLTQSIRWPQDRSNSSSTQHKGIDTKSLNVRPMGAQMTARKINSNPGRRIQKGKIKKQQHFTLATANATDLLPNNAVLNSNHYAQMSVLECLNHTEIIISHILKQQPKKVTMKYKNIFTL